MGRQKIMTWWESDTHDGYHVPDGEVPNEYDEGPDIVNEGPYDCEGPNDYDEGTGRL